MILVALLLRAPEAGEVPATAQAVQQSRRDYAPAEVLKTPPFWVMYVMFVLVGAGGLMAIAQLAPIAKDYKVDAIPVTTPRFDVAGIDLRPIDRSRAQRHLSAVLRLGVGPHRPREHDVHCLPLEGLGIYALLLLAGNPVWFVILSGVVFFAWGEIFSLFPATSTDLYGRKFATANYGMLYTAKGTAALLVPFANVLKSATGSWHAVFYVAAILNIIAAVMALVVLKPMRVKTMANG